MSKNFIDRFYEEDNKDRFWSLNKKIGISLVVFFLAIIMINTTGCTQGENEEVSVTEQPIVSDVQPEKVKVGNDGVNAAIAEDDTSLVADQSMTNKESMVSMSLEDLGRSDPFLPAGMAEQPKPAYASSLEPPMETIVVDDAASEVITTKVSGIMFDKLNPSAILNIGGADYLVRSGDVINGYKVLSIGRETVTVQYQNNVYKASVGELFTGEGLNYNTVANLNNKFGGNKKN